MNIEDPPMLFISANQIHLSNVLVTTSSTSANLTRDDLPSRAQPHLPSVMP